MGAHHFRSAGRVNSLSNVGALAPVYLWALVFSLCDVVLVNREFNFGNMYRMMWGPVRRAFFCLFSRTATDCRKWRKDGSSDARAKMLTLPTARPLRKRTLMNGCASTLVREATTFLSDTALGQGCCSQVQISTTRATRLRPLPVAFWSFGTTSLT